MAVNHPQLGATVFDTTDARALAEFYCDLLGLAYRPGDEPPLHHHTREDETVYVLEGAITAFVGDQRIDVESGSYAALPKGIPHTVAVRGEHARLLVTEEPAGAEYYLVPRDESDADPAKFGIVLDGSPKNP